MTWWMRARFFKNSRALTLALPMKLKVWRQDSGWTHVLVSFFTARSFLCSVFQCIFSREHEQHWVTMRSPNYKSCLVCACVFLSQLVSTECLRSKRQSSARQFFQQTFLNPFQQFTAQRPQFSSEVNVNVDPLPQFTLGQRFNGENFNGQFLENRLDNRPQQTFQQQVQAVPDNQQVDGSPNGQLVTPCATRSGEAGKCTPLVKCISFYAELQELQSQPCNLNANERGVCCPLRSQPGGGGKHGNIRVGSRQSFTYLFCQHFGLVPIR